jgi:hypothetical protein
MTYVLTWLIAILAALVLWSMPVRFEGDVTTAPPPTIAAVDVADP